MLFSVSTLFAWGQSDRGSITGAVTDAAGSSIPGASVTATNEGTGAQNHTVTTGAGEYTIPELPAGVYSVTVESPGFTKLVHSGITVSVNLTIRVDMTLNVGAATTTVNVTSDAPLLKTENPENNITVTSTDFNSLPLNMAGVGAVPRSAILRRAGAWDHGRWLERHSHQRVTGQHVPHHPGWAGLRKRPAFQGFR